MRVSTPTLTISSFRRLSLVKPFVPYTEPALTTPSNTLPSAATLPALSAALPARL